MPTVHKLLTIHAPFAPFIDDTMFATIEKNLASKGITSWWVSPEALPDVVVMVQIPDDLAG